MSSSESSPEAADIDDFQQEISGLCSKINSGDNSYENYETLIKIYQKCGEIEHLRKYREEMSAIYPISPELWVEWIKDEKKCAIDLEQKLRLEDLFSRAFADYSSIELWIEYCSWGLSLVNENNQFQTPKIREIFEKAIKKYGHHFSDGYLVFEMYRDFEKSILASLKEDDEEAILKQIKLIIGIYRRQLNFASSSYDEVVDEYKEFLVNTKTFTEVEKLTSEEESLIVKIQQKNAHLLSFETTLLKTEDQTPDLQFLAMKDYFDNLVKLFAKDDAPKTAKKLAEQKEQKFSVDIEEIMCLGERMLAKFFTQPLAWNGLIAFLRLQLWYDPSRGIELCKRGIRNLPNNNDAWLAMFHFKESSVLKKLALAMNDEDSSVWKDVLDCHSQSLTTFWGTSREWERIGSSIIGFYVRRCVEMLGHLEKLEEKCSKARNKMATRRESVITKKKTFTTMEDLYNQLNSSFLAFQKTIQKSVVKEEQSIALVGVLKRLAFVEAKYFNMFEHSCERFMEVLRFKGLGNSLTHWMDYIRHARDFGCPNTLSHVLSLAINSVNINAEVTGSSSNEVIHFYTKALDLISNDSGLPVNFVSIFEAKIEKRLSLINVNEAKRAAQEEAQDSPPKKKPKNNLKAQTDDKKKKPTENVLKEESLFKVPKVPEVKEYGTVAKHDPAKNDVTVFLSNLSFTATEEDIEKKFREVGEVVNVRLVRDFSGKSKGYAYLEFPSQELAKKALDYDRKRLLDSDPRPMFVSSCNPNREKKFMFNVDQLEKNKLFVKGLLKSTTEETICDFFSMCEGFKEARLVTLRNGHSKGLAYIEFNNEDDASKALKFSDSKEIDGAVISVAFSNPPRKGSSTNKYESDFKTPSVSTKKPSLFIPRAINKSMKTTDPKLETAGDKQKTVESKSNEDFRKMFLK